MIKNFSDIFDLPCHGHKDLEFADVRVGTDNCLFIDPSRIRLAADEGNIWAEKATALMDSFFNALLLAVQNHDMGTVRQLTEGKCCEINATQLGFSVGHPTGTGASFDLIYPAIQQMIDQRLFEQGLVIGIEDFSIWAKGIDADRLSDWITNLIWPVLEEFTTDQYHKYGLEIETNPVDRYAWDLSSSQWVRRKSFPHLCGTQYIYLCPKSFVNTHLLLSIENFLKVVVLSYRQKWHLNKKSALCGQRTKSDGSIVITKPTKRSLMEHEVKGTPHLAYVLTQTQGNPELIQNYHNLYSYHPDDKGVFISDERLDQLLYS